MLYVSLWAPASHPKHGRKCGRSRIGKLSSKFVSSINEPGRYGDGDGLYLRVDPRGGKSWVCRIQKNGRRRDIGLGSAKKVPLKLARQRAAQTIEQVEAGIDPVAERRRAAGIPTFEQAARQVFEEARPAWKNPKHIAQWIGTLERYVFPFIGKRPVDQIDEADVRDVLVRIWLIKPETAHRVYQRIIKVVN